MIYIKKSQKIKFLLLVVLSRNQITRLKSLKQWVFSKKKTGYDTKIIEIEKKGADHNHDKYNATPEFNTLPADVFNARLAQADLVTKTDFDAHLSSLNRKTTTNKSKNVFVENELRKLKTFD